MKSSTDSLDQLARDGYAMLTGIYGANEVQTLGERLTMALATEAPAVLRSRGQTYGSRDLIALFPEVCDISRQPGLANFLVETLGSSAGLVRALFFDKPPELRWSLPWHKDRTIAVARNDLPSSQFRRPTMKAGIPHVEAPESLLARMLTLRLHLDPMTADNGPLSVIPGSHVADDALSPPVELHAAAGDVLAMRPLISHSSSVHHDGVTLHRRIIHLEFAPERDLPDRYQWRWFVKV